MKENVILVRYGEIYLKGKNRHYFESVLKHNINSKLKNYNTSLEWVQGRYVVKGFNANDLQTICNLLSKTAGIYSISPAYEVQTDIYKIKDLCTQIMQQKYGSFRVSTTRADKSFPINSMEYSKQIGGAVLKSNPELCVDLHSPDTNLQIDIRQNGKTYVYITEIMAVSGMPVGTSGKGLLLLSGGIDSPVAGYYMLKRGLKLTALHFESFPYTSPQAKQKAIDLAGVLAEYNGQTDLYVANISKIQEEIHNNCHPDYMITLVRRFMLCIAEKLAESKGLSCLISGESLAQVASQTVESITVITQAMQSNKPFFKPLIGFDKIETINVAKKIGTYDISIKPYDDCCTVFLPDSPVIKPKLEKVLAQEQRLNVEELVQEVVNNIEKITINP